MTRIVWLASYPKSGNTWLRALLANYRREGGPPVELDRLGGGPIASARELFDEVCGVEASDLTAEEIDTLRPGVYRRMADAAKETLFLKIHDAYVWNRDGEPLVPTEATAGAIYVLRNPLDIATSFAHHSRIPTDRAIERMGDETFAFASSPWRLHGQLRQRLLSWSGHALSWVDRSEFPVHVIRYEEMHSTPVETFEGVVRFCGLPVDLSRIEEAVRLSAFDNLRRQERGVGFCERPQGVDAFFRKGRPGAWREELTEAQVGRILRDHGVLMRRFGYLGE